MSSTEDTSGTFARKEGRADGYALVIAWSREEPDRVGELVYVGAGDAGVHWLGRGDERSTWWRQRPGHNEPRPPLGGAKLSREQLRIERVDRGLAVENVGRRAMVAKGRETKQVVLQPGDSVTIEGVLVLACVARPEVLPAVVHADVGAFGEADAWGWVGESPDAWAVREAVAFARKTGGATLVHGPVGAGKSLVAAALPDAHVVASLDGIGEDALFHYRHRIAVPPLSARREDAPLVARTLLRRALTELGSASDVRLGPRLVEAMLGVTTGGARAIDTMIWRGLRTPQAEWVELVEDQVVDEAEPDDEVGELVPVARADVPASVIEGLASLTRAERTVLGWVALNKTSKEIAKALFVSVRTVQNHRARICDKLGLRGHNKLLAVAMALDPKDYS